MPVRAFQAIGFTTDAHRVPGDRLRM